MSDAYSRRISESLAYCDSHPGVAFPAYHIGYEQNERGQQERLYECWLCGHQFRESQGAEADPYSITP